MCVHLPAQPATHSRWTTRQKDSDPLQWLRGGCQSSGLWQESRQALDSALSSRQGMCVCVDKCCVTVKKPFHIPATHHVSTYHLKWVQYLGQTDNKIPLKFYDLLLTEHDASHVAVISLSHQIPLFPLVFYLFFRLIIFSLPPAVTFSVQRLQHPNGSGST